LNGANGYTLKIQSDNENTIFSYSHISPNFIVKIGDHVNQSQIISNVGPKFLSNNDPHTIYKDSSTGLYTNGATTGTHLHFGVKIDGIAIDPLTLFNTKI